MFSLWFRYWKGVYSDRPSGHATQERDSCVWLCVVSRTKSLRWQGSAGHIGRTESTGSGEFSYGYNEVIIFLYFHRRYYVLLPASCLGVRMEGESAITWWSHRWSHLNGRGKKAGHGRCDAEDDGESRRGLGALWTSSMHSWICLGRNWWAA